MLTIIALYSNHANADALSRLPMKYSIQEVPCSEDTIFMLETLRAGDSPVTAVEIKAWMDRDPVRSHVRNMVLNGWRSQVSNDAAFLPFK